MDTTTTTNEYQRPSRFKDAQSCIDYVNGLTRNDEERARKRAMVKGLIDGNPPFDPAELRKAGQAYRCNVNFREAKGYLTTAIGAFYDLYSEAPTIATITPTTGDRNKWVEWGNLMTEQYHKIKKKEALEDWRRQKSQYEMVAYGAGPMFWDDPLDWRPRAIDYGDLLVPDEAPAEVTLWEHCAIRQKYNVSHMHDFIQNEEAAEAVGWRVSAVKASIKKADPNRDQFQGDGWKEIQQAISNNDISYSNKCNTVKCAHILYREKGSSEISWTIVDTNNDQDVLFLKKGAYKNWRQALNAFYYDRGDGTHHNVTGMGRTMYGPMEIKNRLSCSTVDAAFQRLQLLVQPQTPGDITQAQIIPMGPVALLPAGATIIQQNIAGTLDAPMAVGREIDGMISSNLSQYRQIIDKPNGNPRTATEIEALMAQQSTLGKTQLSRYYEQCDAYEAEQYRRAVTIPFIEGDERGAGPLAYLKACREAGIPDDVVRKATASATRVVGQGNPYLRAQVLTELLSASGAMTEGGKQNLIDDWIAAKVGQNMVARYNPKQVSGNEQDQMWQVAVENGNFVDGLNPPVTGTQSHVIHAAGHIRDGATSVQAVQQDPSKIHEVAAYLQVLVAHTADHIRALQGDPVRKADFNQLSKQFTQLVQAAEDLIGEAQKTPESGAGPKPQQLSVEEQMKVAAFQADQARKDAALAADIERKNNKANQVMALSDAKTAHAMATKPAKNG